MIPNKKISVMGATLVLISLSLATTCDAQSYLYAAKAFLAQRKHAMSYVPQPPSDTVLTKVGQWGWGPCLGVAVKGDYAFIGNGALLQVLDIRIPTAPQAVGQILTAGTVFKVMVSGDYAYTISPFQIFDISNPLSPRLVSTFKLPTFYTPTTFTVNGNYAYVGDFNGVIYIIDISNPYSPRVISSIVASGEMTADILVNGTNLFDVTSEGLKIDDFDISVPASPVLVRQLPSWATSLALSGAYLYAGGGGTLDVYDIASPSRPALVGNLNLNGQIEDVAVSGGYAYLALGPQGFAMASVSNPAEPRVLATITDPFGFANQYDVGLGPVAEALISGYAYLSTVTGLWTVRLDNVQGIGSESFFSTGWQPVQITTDSSCNAFIADLCGGLKIVSFANPAVPRLVGEFNPLEAVRDVAVANGAAYVLCDTSMAIIDVSDEAKPAFLGNIVFGDTLNDNNGVYAYGRILVSGTTAYIARNSVELYAVNVADSRHPELESASPLRGTPVAISISGDYLYVGESDLGIQSFDISEPGNPKPIGFISINALRAICVENHDLFALGSLTTTPGEVGVAEYDISAPANPTIKYFLNVPGDFVSADMVADSNFAYLAYNETLLAINISNPDLGYLAFASTADDLNVPSFQGVATLNGKVLVGVGDNGVLIEDNNSMGQKSQPGTHAKCEIALSDNYPNPFNELTTIDYSISASGVVTLKVYDILGRKIETLIDQYQQAGSHSVLFNGGKFATGVYFYQVESNGQVVTNKMILLR